MFAIILSFGMLEVVGLLSALSQEVNIIQHHQTKQNQIGLHTSFSEKLFSFALFLLFL